MNSPPHKVTKGGAERILGGHCVVDLPHSLAGQAYRFSRGAAVGDDSSIASTRAPAYRPARLKSNATCAIPISAQAWQVLTAKGKTKRSTPWPVSITLGPSSLPVGIHSVTPGWVRANAATFTS